MNVDVIIPVYNNSKYLEDALASCMLQTYKDFKIYIIDDNSKENIYKVVKKFENALNICYVKNEVNFGPAKSRNIGIEMGMGELISFLDSDDVWDENKLMNSVNIFYLDKKVGMTCGNYRVWVNRQRVKPPFYSRNIDVNFETLKRVNFVASGSVTVRRAVLDDVGLFNENYIIAEDYDLWIRISKKYKIHYINKVLYLYSVVQDGKSLTKRKDLEEHKNNVHREIKNKYYEDSN